MELHAELKESVVETALGWHMIMHPLVHCLYIPALNETYNRLLTQKREAVSEAEKESDFQQVIWLHERPYRLDAYMACRRRIESLPQRRKLLVDVWMDSENIHQFQRKWINAWREFKSLPPFIDDQREYAKLSSLLTVYRGSGRVELYHGLSWTLDRKKAAWFAKRSRQLEGGSGEGYVTERQIRRDEASAFIFSRGENEAVILPDAGVLDSGTVTGRLK